MPQRQRDSLWGAETENRTAPVNLSTRGKGSTQASSRGQYPFRKIFRKFFALKLLSDTGQPLQYRVDPRHLL